MPGSSSADITSQGWKHYDKGDFALAGEFFAHILDHDKDNYDALIGLGRSQRMGGESDDAVATFTEAAARFPGRARPLVERGALYVLQHQWRQAASDFDAAASLDPDYPGLQSYWSELYLYTGDPQRALDLSRTGLAREPDNLIHKINQGHALLLLDRVGEALECYEDLAGQWHDRKHMSGRAIVESDLRLMRHAEVPIPGLPRVETALSINAAGPSV
jgi:tetratricopeptide (TPR) repeat protein